MTELQQIRKRLEDIEREFYKLYYDKESINKESIKKELRAITQQIYQTIDKASKEEREEINNLIMLKNIIKAKIE